MKIKILNLTIAFILFSLNMTFAQNNKSITIENVSSEVVWPAVFEAFKELKYPRPLIATQQGTGETNYYNYKSLMIKNRLRFKLNYKENKLTISIFERQYYTKSGWGDNPLPMSKKQIAKILTPLKERVTELTKNKTIASTNNKTQTNQEEKTIKKAGIYQDFAIVKTDDSNMDLLAIHKNGNLIGFKLSDDKKTVNSLVFKENNDGEAIILEFNNQGMPVAMGIKNLVIKIESNSSGNLNLFIKDTLGNYLGDQQLSILPLPTPSQTNMILKNNTSHGPNNRIEFATPDISISDGLGYSSYALSQIANGLSGKKVVSKIFVEFGKTIGVTLSDPENKFFLNEISTCVPIVITAITPFVQAALGITVTAASISATAALAVVVGGLKLSWDAGMRIKERHWPTPIFNIYKPSEHLRTGSFGEFRLSSGYIAIEYNYTDKEIEIISEHSEALKVELHNKVDHLDGYDKVYYNVSAKESEYKTHHITAFQKISGFGNYKWDDQTISEEIEIEIKEPKYYYLKNCNDCSDDPSHRKECEERLEHCIKTIKAEDNIYFILDKNDKIIDCNKDLNDARKSYVKSTSIDNHGFKSFVTEATCSYNCEGPVDKQTIITLAHEAMSKIEKIEDKIKGLQSVVNETNYSKVGTEIQTLEKSIKPIKEKCIEEINKITERRTISIPTKKTDPAKYYDIKSLKVSGSHWSMNNITILLEVSYERTPSEKEVEVYSGEVKTYLEDLRELRFQFQFNKDDEIKKYTIPIFNKTKTPFGINFDMFENEINLVDFNASLANSKLIR